MKRFFSLRIITIAVLFSVAAVQSASAAQTTDLQAEYLRCEYRMDPLGIDVTAPRLSWTLKSAERAQRQTAWRVLVASSAQRLENHEGDLWDSGKVQSDETAAVVYAGAALATGQECFWKVRVWDGDDNESEWSAPAKWSMGLLNASDWQARWIGFDPPETIQSTPSVVGQAKWVWNTSNAHQGAAVGTRYFRRSFDVPADWQVQSADCYITADDMFTLYVNGQEIKSGTTHTVLNRVSLADCLVAGSNVLAIQAANQGNSSNPAGLVVALMIESEGGEVLELVSDGQWRASHQAPSGWKTSAFDDSAWTNAAVLGSFGMSPWQGTTPQFLPPPRYLRGDCTIASKPIRKATLYATALGIYQLYVNGKHITPDYFSPGWTDYARRVYYRAYDVTDLLQSGDNAVGAILADGWFAGYVGYARQRDLYGKRLRLLCQVNIEYEDGTTQVVATGPNWRASLGPIRYADFLQGECYDARKEMPGWSSADFNASSWQPAAVGSSEVSPAVQAAVSQPVVAFEEVTPVSVSEPVPGCYVFDLGQNLAGVVRLRIQGQPGQVIQLRHAERLNPDGTIYTTNLRSAAATDTYVCKGGEVETWQPYFTFHGFQYVELTGVDARPPLDTVVGLALSSDTPTVGTFECSDPVVNKLQSNSVWTQRMNFIDIPTDCPQRDERLGWTGDAQVYVNTAAYHNDVQAFFTKWMVDLADAQRADGQFPTVAPLKVSHGDGGPAWADAGVICPWTIYKMYGDRRLLGKHYAAMTKFIDFCKNRCTSELLPPASFHCYGDWLNINDNTPHDVIFMAYFGLSTHLMAEAAAVLGKTADEAEYRQLFEQIKTSFQDAYVAADGKIKGDTQTAYVMAIAYDLLTENQRKLAAGHLVRRIKECSWHLSTGFVGTKDLMLALAKIGRNDIAYRLLHNDTFPSWGFSIKHGATSIWERWNGWTPENGFADPGMNSFAHYSFGAVCQWIFENIGGIQTEGSAFRHILLKPQPGGKLTWAKTAYRSIRGPIKTDWQVSGTVFRCRVEIPPNTTATFYMPAKSASAVTESGQPAGQAPGVTFVRFEDGCAVYTIQSGSYSFQSEISWSKSAWSGDADSRISAGKVYTHKVNLHKNESQTTPINGVVFENDDNRSGPNWVLAGAPWQHSSGGSGVSGDGAGLVSDFFYHEPAQLKLTGLTPQQNYVLTLYTRGFGDVDQRMVGITSSADSSTAVLDQNCYGDSEGGLFRYAYTAPASGELTLTFNAQDTGNTWHHYAFSNEVFAPVYLDPTPTPGQSVLSNGQLSWRLNGNVAAPTYHLTIATNADMADPVVDESGLTAVQYSLTLVPETDYFWQVKVHQADGSVVHTSPVWSFRTLAPPPDAVKVLEWKFDEVQGTAALQAAGEGEGDGLLKGFNDPASPQSRMAGLAGQALRFNGADEHVDISSAYGLMPVADGQTFSICGYLRTFGNYGPIFSMRNSSSETPIIDITLGADGVQDEPGKICVLVRDDTGSMSNLNSGIQVNDGRWHHIAVSRSGDLWTLRIDGVVCGTMTGAAAEMSLDWMGIGASLKWIADDWQNWNTHYRYFHGILDELTVWAGELQPHQLAEQVSILPPQGDLNLDRKTDMADLARLGIDWNLDITTPTQPAAVLENMESYSEGLDTLQDYWVYNPESDFGSLSLSVQPDPAGLYGQILRMDYNFNGRMHAHVPLLLRERRINASLYDYLTIRLRKLPNCDVNKVLFDFSDGRYNADPVAEGMHDKGRLELDLSEIAENQWSILTAPLPTWDLDFASCADLYQLMVSIEDGGADTGTLLIDRIELTDQSPNCIPVVGETATDMNADCRVDLLDLADFIEGWLGSSNYQNPAKYILKYLLMPSVFDLPPQEQKFKSFAVIDL